MQYYERFEDISMMIIANSGAARSKSHEALCIAKKGSFDKAEELLKQAEDSLYEAHKTHRELLRLDAKGEVKDVTLLLTHAQDHLMSSELSLELIKEIIYLLREVRGE